MPSTPSSFSRFAKATARASGRPTTFAIAVGVLIAWAVTGPIFHFSDTWQLVINTGTTIVTFLMVFLIQNTQNRDSEAMQIKLDEVIRSSKGAHNALLDLEELEDRELEAFRQQYLALARRAREGIKAGHSDTGVREVAALEEAHEELAEEINELKAAANARRKVANPEK